MACDATTVNGDESAWVQHVRARYEDAFVHIEARERSRNQSRAYVASTRVVSPPVDIEARERSRNQSRAYVASVRGASVI